MRRVTEANPPLAPWAQRETDSRGRRYPQREHPYRPIYARDRDRIIHSRAFRRLEYKTQVFVNHEGDHYRTRLTHSIEVSQIARTVCRALALNSDLAESLALGHDLGHTPFGHLGEEVLGPLLIDSGGFNHNRQTLRVVELLEQRYPDFPGLNLTWEVREGIAKHSGPADLEQMPEARDYWPGVPPPLEAQMIDLVDEIAYNHHDIEDGLESRLLDVDELTETVALFGRPYREASRRHPTEGSWMWAKEALRKVIDRLVSDLVLTTRGRLEELRLSSVEDVRRQPGWLIGLSDVTERENRELKAYLWDRLYRHPRIQQTKRHCARVLRELFQAYSTAPEEMPERFQQLATDDGLARGVCDYMAGMTDRFALQEHHRLCGGPGPDAVPSATH
ncbi:MAG: deoxyguanosinetriphosphate triphosphohydrolase [Acidobacteriota bacterium]|nr:MAG: deoxyguanosinetriphosphate triphosphohydrolase [Acidobacteriota bacterium]